MNFVGGEWVPAASGQSFEDRNPADRDDLLGTFPRSGSSDVDAAVRAAAGAFRDWMLTPAPTRADHLLRVGIELERRKEDLASLMVREMGKTIRECRADVQEGIDFAFYMAGEGRRMHGLTLPSELPDRFSMMIRHPIGVAALITPWNFPIAIPLWKIAPAIVAGCTMVLKPAEDTPLLATELVRVFEGVGLPPGVLNLVHGYGEEAGWPLVEHPGVGCVSFTGSLDVGRMVNEVCGRMMKRCSLELGSKNCLIVMPDAEMDVAVEAAAWGAFATSGQRCTATSRIVTHRAAHDAFVGALVARVERFKVGPGDDPEVDVTPVINARQKERVLSYIGVGREEGAELLTGGVALDDPPWDRGNFIAPTVFDRMTPDMRIAQEEIFGPVTGVMTVSSLDEAIAWANSTQYGLSCSIYTREIGAVYRAIRELEFGIVYVNAPTIGAEVQLPFGGMKSTGNGHREAGPLALDEFTEWKSVSVDYSGKVQKAQFD